ncbi:MAG: TetR/AcrR family transcriptional regulator [Desulfobacterium sp.]|nr:TetR/AcrR family transcriptional regulator [Desulfobacterium sp.]
MNPKDMKYRELFSVSLELFALFGYKKTTVQDVADRLGMTKGNLYFYVKNKQDLYLKTITHALDLWRDSVKQAVDRETDPVVKFRTMALKSVDYIENNAMLRQILMNDPSIFTLSSSEDRFYEINQSAMTIIQEILNQGIEAKRFHPVDVEHVTQYFFSIYVMFLIKTYVKSDTSSSRTMFLEALELNIRGLLLTDGVTPA